VLSEGDIWIMKHGKGADYVQVKTEPTPLSQIAGSISRSYEGPITIPNTCTSTLPQQQLPMLHKPQHQHVHSVCGFGGDRCGVLTSVTPSCSGAAEGVVMGGTLPEWIGIPENALFGEGATGLVGLHGQQDVLWLWDEY